MKDIHIDPIDVAHIVNELQISANHLMQAIQHMKEISELILQTVKDQTQYE